MEETGQNELHGTAGARNLWVHQRRFLEISFLAEFEQQLRKLSEEL